MSEFLDQLLPDLTGAEFKIASYLCQQLEKQAVVDTTIAALSRATGVSWRHTQTCVQSLAKKDVLLVHSRKGHGIECRLPVATPTASETVSPSQPRAGIIERVPAAGPFSSVRISFSGARRDSGGSGSGITLEISKRGS